MRWLTVISFFCGFLFAAESGFAQSVRRPHGYDKLDAGYEAWQLGEERRRYAIGRQVWLNNEMILWSRSFPSWRYFAEPLPFLPGDIYGYPLAEPPIRQPIDQVETQIGPNTWFSGPVYDFPPAPHVIEKFALPVQAEEIIPEELPSWAAGPREF